MCTLSLALVLVLHARAAPAHADPGPWSLAQDDVLYTDTDNLRVLTSQVGVAHDLDADGGRVSAQGLVDVISAASVDVVSHATTRFSEVRVQGDLAASYALGSDLLPDVSYRISREPDYDSQSFGAGATFRLAGADSVAAAHYTLTLDRVGRVDTPRSVFGEPLTSHTGDLSFTQNLGRQTVARIIYTLTLQRGYMEKPYRFVPMFDQGSLAQATADGVRLGLDTFGQYSLSLRPAESVPDERVRHALAARFMQYIEPIAGSLRLDERFYIDDWLVIASTTELALWHAIGSRFRLESFARGHAQSGASFWERTYVLRGDALPAYRTLDRKLSPYWALTVGTRAEYEVEHLACYLELAATQTHFLDSLLIDQRSALVSQLGVEYRP